MNANNTKLQSLANELNATIKHAVDVMDEYISTSYREATIEAFNELDENEQVILVFGTLDKVMNQEVKTSLLEELVYNAVKAKHEEILDEKFSEKVDALIKLLLN